MRLRTLDRQRRTISATILSNCLSLPIDKPRVDQLNFNVLKIFDIAGYYDQIVFDRCCRNPRISAVVKVGDIE